ncbi:MAG: hypothetical protein SFT90_03420 [Rickettsiales bacterium]|nr:hypothetical protein [Rickettsiales bacterium]
MKNTKFNIKNTDKILLEKSDFIMLLTSQSTNDSGENYYAFVRANKKGIEDYNKAIEQGLTIEFKNFGEVLLEGKGEPTELEKIYIKEKFSKI